MNDTQILFYLLSYAGQQFEAGYCYGAVDASEEEAAAIKKYDAAILVIADIWTGGDTKKAEALASEFSEAAQTKFTGWESGPALHGWKHTELNDCEGFMNPPTPKEWKNFMDPPEDCEPPF